MAVKARNRWRSFRQGFGAVQVLVIALAALGIWWLVGTVNLMGKNYQQQIAFSEAVRQRELLGLEVEEARYTLEYHQTAEYQELRLREQGLVMPGESVLLLPLAEAEKPLATPEYQPAPENSHLEQWRRFFNL